MGVVKREPWEVVCPCGKTFLTACYTAHLCPECQKEKEKERKRRYRQTQKGSEVERRASRKRYNNNKEQENERCRRYHAEHREARLLQQKAWRTNNAERRKKCAKLKKLQAKGDPVAKLELAKLQGKVLYCERMRVTAMTLPCGKRDECWHGKPCPRTVELGLTPPKKRELFDFGHVF